MPTDAHVPVVAILCGGVGSRLGELTREVPKAMIPVGGRPYLEHVIESFAERGLRRFVLLTGFRHEAIETHFGDGSGQGVSIVYSREFEPLGTGGALRQARPLLGQRFVLTYGDVLRRFDYDRFVVHHLQSCVAVYPRVTVGNIAVEGDLVVAYDKNWPELPYIDAGFSIMSTMTIDLLPERGACSFESVVFTELARRRELTCEIVDHHFFDIGTPDDLQRTRAALETP